MFDIRHVPSAYRLQCVPGGCVKCESSEFRHTKERNKTYLFPDHLEEMQVGGVSMK
jgi:hypothetical protein